MSKIAKLDAHTIRANMLRKLVEDARIEEEAEEGEENPEGDGAAFMSAQREALPEEQSDRGQSGKAEEAAHSLGVQPKAQGGQRQSWFANEDPKVQPGERGGDSGGAGMGNAKEGSRHEGLAFPGAVVLDMRELTGGVRGMGDRSSCSRVDGVRGDAGKQGREGVGPPADAHEREDSPSSGSSARRKSYPESQYRKSFAGQQQTPATQS
eukprot:scaffold123489_cov14-Tisochrysis_lutea.AAC.1